MSKSLKRIVDTAERHKVATKRIAQKTNGLGYLAALDYMVAVAPKEKVETNNDNVSQDL